MDLRVYVDGVARIICDLTPNTTVHDIIIALAQYKGQAGRYSLLERTPDGSERTVSPNELTAELLKHSEYSYILQQNISNDENHQNRKRSKSVDGQKTLVQTSSITEGNPAVVTSTSCSSSSSASSGHHRTVEASKIRGSVTFSSSTKSSQKKKHPSLHHLFPLANINSNNNNNNSVNNNDFVSYAVEQKRASRVPIQIIEQDFGTIDNQVDSFSGYHRIQRPRTHYSVSKKEHSAFHVVDQTTSHPQQQQYMALLKMLKTQEIQVGKQEKELLEKQQEIEYREKAAQQLQLEHEQHVFNQQLDHEVEYHKQLNGNYDHLQQQIKHCSTNLEKKHLLQEQIQTNIDRLHREIDDLQSKNHATIRDMRQYEQDLERCNFTVHQQEDLFYILADRNNDIERLIEQRRNYINQLENELIQLDDLLLKNITHSTNQCGSSVSVPIHYHSCSSSNGTTDPSTPIRLQFVNSTVWKLCPSGIWV